MVYCPSFLHNSTVSSFWNRSNVLVAVLLALEAGVNYIIKVDWDVVMQRLANIDIPHITFVFGCR